MNVLRDTVLKNGTDGTEKTVQQIIKAELDKCAWEWKQVDLDNKFRISQLNRLGKEGWRFAFIHETASDSKPNHICLQRPRINGKKS